MKCPRCKEKMLDTNTLDHFVCSACDMMIVVGNKIKKSVIINLN